MKKMKNMKNSKIRNLARIINNIPEQKDKIYYQLKAKRCAYVHHKVNT